MTTRRHLILAALALPLVARPALAAELSLGEISAYLNSIRTASSDFTQINDDGSVSTGKLYISRPGKVRFEYAPPDNNLVLASNGAVAIFDAKSNAAPEQYPLSQTPLSLILDANVDLSRRNMVVGRKSDGKTTTVIAQDPKNPDYGNIQLVFTANPTELRQWVITDGAGSKTTVILGHLALGESLGRSLFDIGSASRQRRAER